jgi:hypothetical protein
MDLSTQARQEIDEEDPCIVIPQSLYGSFIPAKRDIISIIQFWVIENSILWFLTGQFMNDSTLPLPPMLDSAPTRFYSYIQQFLSLDPHHRNTAMDHEARIRDIVKRNPPWVEGKQIKGRTTSSSSGQKPPKKE